jgi:Tfp pilus assembly PilM family ATPase
MNKLLARFKRVPTDVVGVDLGAGSVKAVRMRKTQDDIVMTAAAILPSPLAANEEGATYVQRPVSLPGALKGRYVSLATTSPDASVKLLSFPGPSDHNQENRILDSLGLANPEDYRISYRVVREGHARTETRVLAVALPMINATTVLAMFPAGIPAPYSIEVSGLATASTFAFTTGIEKNEGSVGLVDFGAECTSLSLFSRGTLALVRRFHMGTYNITQSVCDTLGVDAETAEGIVNDGAFDISQSISDVLSPVVKQIIISRDFVERREDCTISNIYLSGPKVLTNGAIDSIRSALEVDVHPWNPTDGINMTDGCLSKKLEGQEWRLSAAMGACLGTLEQT